MTESTPTPPPAATPLEAATRRACDQWIRDALKENKSDVALLRTELTELHNELKLFNSALNSFMECALGSMPNKDPKAHLSAHERWELDEAEKQKRREEDAKLRTDVRNGIIKTVVNVVLVAAAGVVMLGIQAQFGIWVNSVKAPATETPKGTTK